jgi:hypothetical protein
MLGIDVAPISRLLILQNYPCIGYGGHILVRRICLFGFLLLVTDLFLDFGAFWGASFAPFL